MCKLWGSSELKHGELMKVNFFRSIFSALFFESKGSSEVSDRLRLQPVKYTLGLSGEDCFCK